MVAADPVVSSVRWRSAGLVPAVDPIVNLFLQDVERSNCLQNNLKREQFRLIYILNVW